jgi:hypothetical protein
MSDVGGAGVIPLDSAVPQRGRTAAPVFDGLLVHIAGGKRPYPTNNLDDSDAVLQVYDADDQRGHWGRSVAAPD